jgi:hypothetical protein
VKPRSRGPGGGPSNACRRTPSPPQITDRTRDEELGRSSSATLPERDGNARTRSEGLAACKIFQPPNQEGGLSGSGLSARAGNGQTRGQRRSQAKRSAPGRRIKRLTKVMSRRRCQQGDPTPSAIASRRDLLDR